MPEFIVTYPIVGTVSVMVEADDESAAIDKGWNNLGGGDVAWDAVTQIVEGNVFHGEQNEITVEPY